MEFERRRYGQEHSHALTEHKDYKEGYAPERMTTTLFRVIVETPGHFALLVFSIVAVVIVLFSLTEVSHKAWGERGSEIAQIAVFSTFGVFLLFVLFWVLSSRDLSGALEYD